MHICFNALDYPTAVGGSGVGNQVSLLGRALVEAGHRVTVIGLARPGLPDYAEDQGVRVHRVHCGNWHWYLSKIPLLGRLLILPIRELERAGAAYRKIAALHAQDPIDVIEGTETGMFWLRRRLPDVPYLVRLHGEPYTFCKYTPGERLTLGLRLCRLLQRMALRRARALVSPSAAHAKEIAAELGPDRPPVEVVPNTLGSQMIAAGKAPPAGEDAADVKGPIVLYVGRLERGKGVLTLLEAAAEVLRAVPDAHLVLAGARHPSLDAGEFGRLLDRLPGKERVHLLGHVPWSSLFDWYRRASVCVLPSFYETFGLAALEPMAFGAPVVASRVAGLPEVIEDGVCGLLVPPGDAQALAQEVVGLLRDPARARRLGDEARRRAAGQFQTAAHLKSNVTLLEWTAGKSGTPGPVEHIFFSPHLDDAALSCGGLIHAAMGRGESVRAITVFASASKRPALSAFARHLHEKWGLRDSAPARLEEDRQAFAWLGVRDVEHWEFLEAPYRHDAGGDPLYCTYEGLKGKPASADAPLIEELVRRARLGLPDQPDSCRLYFPLGLGGHVDHRLLFQVGRRLRSAGWDVRFYEDWPYAESYQPSPTAIGWLSEGVDIAVDAKHAAVLAYRSQLRGLTASAKALRERMLRYARKTGGGRPHERYWFVTPATAAQMVARGEGTNQGPFVKNPPATRLGRLRRTLAALRRTELTQLLPPGAGNCLDVTSVAGDRRRLIERRGYAHVEVVPGEALPTHPTRPEGHLELSAVVAWAPEEQAVAPKRLIQDAFRVLQPGGVLVGCYALRGPSRDADDLEPKALEQQLRQQGFRDVEVIPGRSGVTGRMAAWARRRLGGPGRYLAAALMAGRLAAGAGLGLLTCWFRRGHGAGQARKAHRPAEGLLQADHVAFVARTPAPRMQCTLDF